MQGLLKKHEAFESDVAVHRGRVRETETTGESLISEVLKRAHAAAQWGTLHVHIYNVYTHSYVCVDSSGTMYSIVGLSLSHIILGNRSF